MSERHPNKLAEPGRMSAETKILASVLGIGGVAVLTLWAAARVGTRLAGKPAPVPGDPVAVAGNVVVGHEVLPTASWAIVAALGVLLLTLAVAVGRSRARRRAERTRVDRVARWMGQGSDLTHLGLKATAAKARELQVRPDVIAAGKVGVEVGRTEHGKRRIFGSWVDMHLVVAGPRDRQDDLAGRPGDPGRPRRRPGDVEQARRRRRDPRPARHDWSGVGVRLAAGRPRAAHVVVGTVTYVVDDTSASQLAQHFASGSRELCAKTDAYFDPAGQDLLAGLLLAAALDGRPITDVYTWLTRPDGDAPSEILRDHGYDLVAQQVQGVQGAPDKQRGGI
ncbi:hypothetical protein [Cellulomonas sp. JH27-2]|uniref:hypothetical protein n=1 Tax=Cellulomonas sp. JH27-2 TaxID=2774139 RepID=UPI001CD84B8C|nr:hypothetical protein [Cellulomonas sp. JH27-2]